MPRVGDVFQGNYLKASDLEGHTVKVTIGGFKMEEIGEEGDKKEKPVLYFHGKKKALVLNVTNANMIADIIGTDELDDWVDHAIEIYPARVDFKGKQVDAIRVRDTRPPPPAAEEGEGAGAF